MTLTYRRLTGADLPDAVERAVAAFGTPRGEDTLNERLRERVDHGALVGVESDGRVLAHGAVWPADHWIGGQRVPCQHVASVAVAPEDRGRGAGSALMRHVIAEGAREGLGLSLLFPALDGMYRALGWEQAGAFAWWRLECRSARVAGRGPRVRRLDLREPADRAAVRACHARFAAGQPCLEAREESAWSRLEDARFAWGHDGHDGLDAYALVDHESITGDWRYRLRIRDWAATSPEGLRALVAFVGGHGTTAADAVLRGPIPHPWSLVLPEQDLALTGHFHWMARGLDLPTAIAARGFPAAVRASVALRIDDPELPDARGPWRLSVADGHGSLEPLANDDDVLATARLDATAVGPLLTGHRTAEQLALAGRASGDAGALAALTAAFAGPQPTLADFF